MKKQYKLKQLTISSFTTNLLDEGKETIVGGGPAITGTNPAAPASPLNTPGMTIDFWKKSIPAGVCSQMHKMICNNPLPPPEFKKPGCGNSACMSAPGDYLYTCDSGGAPKWPAPVEPDVLQTVEIVMCLNWTAVAEYC